MSDFSSQQIVEALRSGVPSRTVGAYFSEARPAMRCEGNWLHFRRQNLLKG